MDKEPSPRLRAVMSPGTQRLIADAARQAEAVNKLARRQRFVERATNVFAGAVVAGALVLVLVVVAAAVIGLYALARTVF